MNVDAAAPLKKNAKADIVEISDAHKKLNTHPEKTNDSTLKPDTEELVNHIKNRAKEIRESIPKPIPAEVVWGFINSNPNEEEIEQQKALAAKLQKIDSKLQSGKRLSEEEMAFLAEHYPEYYLAAKRIEMEREHFRKQLKNCDTEEEKERLIMLKKGMLLAEAQMMLKSKQAPIYVTCMLAAMDEEIMADGPRRSKAEHLGADAPMPVSPVEGDSTPLGERNGPALRAKGDGVLKVPQLQGDDAPLIPAPEPS